MAGMPERGLEPPPSYLDKNLNLARLPIPPLGQVGGRPESPADFENDATSGRRRYNYREKGDKKKATAATLTKKDKEVPVLFLVCLSFSCLKEVPVLFLVCLSFSCLKEVPVLF